MDLTIDARGIPPANYDIAERTLNAELLNAIEGDLDLDEKISIVFLMVTDYKTAFDTAWDLYKKIESKESCVLTEIVTNYGTKWKDSLLEALCVIQNKQIIKKLGLCYSELEPLYLPRNRLCSKNFNKTIKCLYMMCESLNGSQIKELIELIKCDIQEYEAKLNSIYILELHLLYWMKKEYISISNDGRTHLRNLFKYLKGFEGLELIYSDLKKSEDRPNVLDTYNTPMLNNSMPQSFSSSNDNQAVSYTYTEGLRKIQKGLCIIISQVFFSGQKYDTRFGTAADCTRLTETFKGFGFHVVVFENLKRLELLSKLGNIPKEFGTTYDCIFICILSHGCRGTIIASDEEEVPIELIEKKICCIELTDVFKIVVIQACQGKLTGQMDPLETTDGPNESNVANIASYRNFCLFMSTIQGFVSVRHKLQGSWFIQEFCNILQSGGNNLSFYQLVGKVMQSVEKKRGKLDGTDAVAQLPELRSCRLLSDFQLPKYTARE